MFTFALRKLLQPMNRLPQETISRIARNAHDHLDEDTSFIVPLTHVCESIVSTPENWTMISNSHSNLAASSLERAKMPSPDIYLNTRTITFAFSDLLAPRVQNTGSCCVRVGSTIEALTHRLPNFPWSPKLQALEISKPGRTDLD